MSINDRQMLLTLLIVHIFSLVVKDRAKIDGWNRLSLPKCKFLLFSYFLSEKLRDLCGKTILRVSENSVMDIFWFSFTVKGLIHFPVQLSDCFCIHRFPKCLHFVCIKDSAGNNGCCLNSLKISRNTFGIDSHVLIKQMFIHTLFYLFELSSLGVLLKLSESN